MFRWVTQSRITILEVLRDCILCGTLYYITIFEAWIFKENLTLKGRLEQTMVGKIPVQKGNSYCNLPGLFYQYAKIYGHASTVLL